MTQPVDQPTQPEARRHGCPRHHWRRVRPLRGTEYYQCIHCEVKDCELPASSCQPCSECGGINAHEYACVFNKSHQPGWLGRVLPSERSAGDERQCLDHCAHGPSWRRDGVCYYPINGIDREGNCSHRCAFASDDERKHSAETVCTFESCPFDSLPQTHLIRDHPCLASDEGRKCLNHCDHDLSNMNNGLCYAVYNKIGICGHRCAFAPRLIESLWGGNLPALCDTCKSDLSREGRGTHGWDASRNQILCPTVCKFPRKDGHTFAPRDEFKDCSMNPSGISKEASQRSSSEAEVHGDDIDTSELYGVGGEVYTFIHMMRGDLAMAQPPRPMMSTRAQQLLNKIAVHDKQVKEIARQVTEECKAEMPATSLEYAADSSDPMHVYQPPQSRTNVIREQQRNPAPEVTAVMVSREPATIRTREEIALEIAESITLCGSDGEPDYDSASYQALARKIEAALTTAADEAWGRAIANRERAFVGH